MNQDRAKQLVAETKKIACQVDSWIALSNALSDPQGGLIAWYVPISNNVTNDRTTQRQAD